MLLLFALFFLWSCWYFAESSCYFYNIPKKLIFLGFPYIFFALCTPCICGYKFGQNLIKHYTLKILKDYDLVCLLSNIQQSKHLASTQAIQAIVCFIHWRFHICREEFELFHVSLQINISLPKTMIMTSQVSITWHFIRAILPESMHVQVILGLIIWRFSSRVEISTRYAELKKIAIILEIPIRVEI